jgi:hypothetical protein
VLGAMAGAIHLDTLRPSALGKYRLPRAARGVAGRLARAAGIVGSGRDGDGVTSYRNLFNSASTACSASSLYLSTTCAG